MRLALLAAALLSLLACNRGGPPPRSPDAPASACPIGTDPEIRALGAAFVQSAPAVGVSIGIQRAGAAECYDFGVMNRATGAPPTPQTVYEIGSLTKTFASALLARAVLEQRLQLDDDIRRFLPEPYPDLEFAGQPIRVVHLANLTAELPNWLPDRPELFADLKPEEIPAALLAVHRDYSRADFYRDLHQVRLAAAPGSRPRHSNVSAQLLSFILERVYGRPYEALLAEFILGPLAMDRTAFHAGQPPASLARGYDASGREMPYVDMQDLKLAGGLTSTSADMLKYVAFQLDETREEVALGHRVTVEAEGDAIGLSWHIDRGAAGAPTIWHTGGTFGFSSYLVLHPARELGLVLLANESDPQSQTRLVELADRIAQHLAARD
ncbi:serine hydrolase domain-containing protein [Nannocystis punicea]|uniref:Serine hydrolase n=1 Tax=Nannocystis punicea TaxID=2995304 RepID=A0ABY7H8P0_9BACT|nr:serine hydrolase domain-containing protein [Nannocystis poenicansa]WAS95636.1 serine hydrolase [Nannocystis poenicansa]